LDRGGGGGPRPEAAGPGGGEVGAPAEEKEAEEGRDGERTEDRHEERTARAGGRGRHTQRVRWFEGGVAEVARLRGWPSPGSRATSATRTRDGFPSLGGRDEDGAVVGPQRLEHRAIRPAAGRDAGRIDIPVPVVPDRPVGVQDRGGAGVRPAHV